MACPAFLRDLLEGDKKMDVNTYNRPPHNATEQWQQLLVEKQDRRFWDEIGHWAFGKNEEAIGHIIN